MHLQTILEKEIGRPFADQEKMECLIKNRNQEHIKINTLEWLCWLRIEQF